jgi:hypothetical protein
MFDADERDDAVLDLRHANEFTDVENVAIVYVLRGWFANLAGIPGSLEAGDDAWAFTTLAEHFISLLNADPAKRTPTRLKIKDKLLEKAKASQDALDSILGAETGEDERMNTEVDDFVSQVASEVEGQTALG